MPLEQLANDLVFRAFYAEDGLGKTGLTVTVDIYAPDGTLLVDDDDATEQAGGLYRYTLDAAEVDAEGEYVAIFKTADTGVSQRHIPAVWVVNRAGIEYLDAPISLAASRPNGTVYVNILGEGGVVNPRVFTVKRNDREPPLNAALKNLDDSNVNLTGATVKFLMTLQGGSTPKVNAAATIVDALLGQVRYSWGATDLDTVGKYNGEFEVTFPGGNKQTFPSHEYITVRVVADLG